MVTRLEVFTLPSLSNSSNILSCLSLANIFFYLPSVYHIPKSFVASLTFPFKRRSPIRFGIIINPNTMSCISHTIFKLLREPIIARHTNTYLKYESSIDVDHAILIQAMIDGQEYGLDIINDLEGNYQNTIVKKKVAMRSGETDCAETVDSIEIKQIGEKLSKTIKHIANLDCDVFVTSDNTIYVLEMNARFGGGYPFSHLAGVNLPMAIIKWLSNESVDIKELLTAKPSVYGQKDINIVRIK